MKKQLCFILALTLLAALVAVPVFALPNADDYPGITKPKANDIVTLTGFYNIGETDGVTVQAATAGGIVAGQQMSVDVDDNTTYDDITMYPDSDRLRVTFTGAVADKQYFIMLSRGAEKSTSAALFYVNQLSGSAIQNFTVNSSLLTADEPVLTLWLISEDSNDDAVSVSMSYLAGTAHYKEPVAVVGHTVSGTVTSYGDAENAVTISLKSEDTVVASTTAIGNSANYSLEGIADGTYTLVVEKASNVSRTYAISVTGDDFVQNLSINLKGDVNNDGAVDILDYQRLYSHLDGSNLITDSYQLVIANVNSDAESAVDILDYQRLYSHLDGSNPLQ